MRNLTAKKQIQTSVTPNAWEDVVWSVLLNLPDKMRVSMESAGHRNEVSVSGSQNRFRELRIIELLCDANRHGATYLTL